MNQADSKAAGIFLFGNVQQIRDVTVTFDDGSSVSGFVKSATTNDYGPVITLCRHSTRRDEEPFVDLDFDRIKTVKITLQDGTSKTF